MIRKILPRFLLAAAVWGSAAVTAEPAERGITFEHIAAMRSVGSVAISPDGSRIAYTLSVPRRPGVDDDGSAGSTSPALDTTVASVGP